MGCCLGYNSSFTIYNCSHMKGEFCKMGRRNNGFGLTGIMVVIIAVVLVLGIIAVSQVVGEKRKARLAEERAARIADGTAVISELADSEGYTLDEFLAMYGLSDSGVSGNERIYDVMDKLTIANYVKLQTGAALTEEELAELKTAKGLADDVTLDSTDNDVKTAYDSYKAEQDAAAQAAQSQANEMNGGIDTDAEAADAVEAPGTENADSTAEADNTAEAPAAE